MNLPYVQKHKNAFRYRRKYPEDISTVLGKLWHLAPLGKTEAQAADNWKRVNAAYDKAVKDVRDRHREKSPFETYTESVSLIRQLGFDPSSPYDRATFPDDADGEDAAREQAAAEIIERYPLDPSGHPVGMSAAHELLVRSLLNGAPPRPSPRLSDIVSLYKAEKCAGEDKREKKYAQRVDRVAELFTRVIGADAELLSINREDARRFRDALAETGIKPESVRRGINIIRAVVNHAIHENGLANSYSNPFNKLPIANLDAETDVEKRDPLPTDVLQAVRSRVLSRGKTELQLIWRLLEGTGCRLAEITGLRVSDVEVSTATPYITVEWHEDRRVKTKASRRDVPLLGDTLEAAKEALRLAKGRAMLFDAYGNENGPDNASAALMKHVRAVTKNPLHVVHSLRHNMSDWLRAGGAQEREVNLTLGHSLSGTGSRNYGSKPERLRATTEAMKKAHEVKNREAGPIPQETPAEPMRPNVSG
ncbi:tyrosine-type recombinase/integrase [Rhizobium sp. R86522]|uniref:tyrosine-type recombinase/integrase n=1 Tax=Rhizobium sp. R86522 TaxID=3093861 RepID=UPI003671DFF0